MFWVDHFPADAEFESPRTGQVYKSVQAARVLWKEELGAALGKPRDESQADQPPIALEELIDLDERVVSVLRISGRDRRSGLAVSQQVAIVWAFEGERMVRAKLFTSRAEALQAVGLRE